MNVLLSIFVAITLAWDHEALDTNLVTFRVYATTNALRSFTNWAFHGDTTAKTYRVETVLPFQIFTVTASNIHGESLPATR